MYDVISVGSSTVDVFAKVESELIKIKSMSHEEELIAYPSGSKILIKDLNFMTGGGGTNTSVCFRRLGLSSAYLGKVGDDENCEIIMKMLKSEKVPFVGVKAKGGSGYSIILNSLDGDRTILAHKGVNNDLSFEEISLSKIKTKWFYFSSMMGRSFETIEMLARYAKDKGINIAFNPSNYLAEKGKHYLKEIFDRTDLLVLNKEESMLIVGKDTPENLVRKLMELGPKQVVVTDGKKGAYTWYGGKNYHAIPHEVRPVETTGAGDAFASTFLAGKILGKTTEYSLKMAILNSESVIMQHGAKNDLLDMDKLSKRIKKRPPKVVVSKD